MAAPQKVSLYSLSELKSTLDDHVPIYLTSPNTPSSKPLPKSARFQPTYFLTYVRLGLGYVSVLIALYIFYLDYILKKDWKETRWIVWIGVPVYFTLSGALQLFQWFVEKGVIFEGTRAESGKNTTIKIESHQPHKKYDPVYRLTVSWTVAQDASKSGTMDITAPFTKFYTADGYFAPVDFEAWLRHEIPIVATPGAQVGKTDVIKPQGAELLGAGTSTTDADGNVSVESPGQIISSQRGDTIVLNTEASPKKRGRPKKDA